jgi:hypothetical protein
MTDLAQTLVDAAATADWQAQHKAILDHLKRGPGKETQLRISVARARAVTVAVLETLARAEQTFGVGTLEDLAAEIREGR